MGVGYIPWIIYLLDHVFVDIFIIKKDMFMHGGGGGGGPRVH